MTVSTSLAGVVIYNRGDCCMDRLSDTTVLLLDENDNVLGTYRIGDASNSQWVTIGISFFTSP